MAASNKIVLTSSDGESFEVDETVARQFQIVAHMIEDDCVSKAIPLTNVTADVLGKAIEYCKKHVEAGSVKEDEDEAGSVKEDVVEAGSVKEGEVEAASSKEDEANEELKTWDAEFIELDSATLFKLVLAANYLNIRGLLDLGCQKIADLIQDKKPEEVRQFFNIENDYTPEEEAEAKTFSALNPQIKRTMSESTKIVLTSQGGEAFEVDEAVAREFQIVAHMIDDGCAGKAIPLENVTGDVLAKVIEYCKKHVEAGSVKKDEIEAGSSKEGQVEAGSSGEDEPESELKAWDEEFLKLDMDTLFKILLAANYLNIKSLLDVVCQKIADLIKHKQPEEIREIFNIQNDFTPEEEDAVRKENAWAFE
ncbi:unnamed protein product [Thlaspi arvense]|uniref:SKP1-like protein n=1 Tax=Thlaspi arvense TaxID=13288 RepID=A0AAU9RM61_THLAR|nr:unnamed protein product [Thlaspi arvense]